MRKARTKAPDPVAGIAPPSLAGGKLGGSRGGVGETPTRPEYADRGQCQVKLYTANTRRGG